MQPGFYAEMPDSVYHGLEGYSKTVLCEVTPFDYWAKRIYSGPKPDETEKDSYLQGCLFHCMKLEPHRVAEVYVKNEGLNKNKKGEEIALRRGTKAYEEWAEKNPGKKLISVKMWEECERMVSMMGANRLVSSLFSKPGFPECSFVMRCPATGVWIRCRPDYWLKTQSATVVDLKTCGGLKASPKKFPWEAFEYHYHISGALTLDIIEKVTGSRPDRYLYVTVEKPWPHRSAVWEVTPKGLQVGRDYYRNRIRMFELCKKTGYYPTYVSAENRTKENPFEYFRFVEEV